MTFRFARHTNNLNQLKNFYVNILGFELLSSFENHAGYSGIIIGYKNENWHLEFTKSEDVVVFNFHDDDNLVLYPSNKTDYDLIISRIRSYKIEFIQAKNSFWNENGKMFLDPDGYRIVISDIKSKK
ncbi:MAG: hypothetical protein RL699_859 [Bacteroidota bacterium]|jgi:catechol 2,3-dioxygenase-like lactoylglutathione lyase family enzyme